MTEALLPCPFCGHPPTIQASADDQVSCENLACPVTVLTIDGHEWMDDAIKAWNTRAMTPLPGDAN